MLLSRIDDPRDNLLKRRRVELWDYAKRNGITEIHEDMPARMMRSRLRKRGVADLDTPMLEPILGAKRGTQAPVEPPRAVQQVNADDELERAYAAQEAPAERPKMKIWELRKKCKEAGHKVKNTHKAYELRAMLDGQNAS